MHYKNIEEDEKLKLVEKLKLDVYVCDTHTQKLIIYGKTKNMFSKEIFGNLEDSSDVNHHTPLTLHVY